MGFMTEISFLNDTYPELEAYMRSDLERFFEELRALMNGAGDNYPGRFRRFAGTMYRSHHADEPHVYLSLENVFVLMNRYSLERQYGEGLSEANETQLAWLEKAVKTAESELRAVKKIVREKRAAIA